MEKTKSSQVKVILMDTGIPYQDEALPTQEKAQFDHSTDTAWAIQQTRHWVSVVN